MNDNCIFCKIIKREIPSRIIYEDELTLAFLNINPLSDGHSLIIPKKHFDNFSSTEEPYLDAVNKTKQIVAKMIKNSSLKPEGFNYLANEGAVAEQTVNHYHEHVIPKYVHEEGFVLVPTEKANIVLIKEPDEIIEILTK